MKSGLENQGAHRSSLIPEKESRNRARVPASANKEPIKQVLGQNQGTN